MATFVEKFVLVIVQIFQQMWHMICRDISEELTFHVTSKLARHFTSNVFTLVDWK